MKKILSLTMALTMLGAAFTGCGSKGATAKTPAENTQQATPARQEQRQTDGDQGNRQTAPAIALQAEEEKGQKCQEQEKQEYQEAGTGRALGQ